MNICDSCSQRLAGRAYDTGDGDIVCEKCFKLRRPNGKPMPAGSSHGHANQANGVVVQGSQSKTIKRTQKKNTLTLAHLNPGSYSVRSR